MSDQARVSSIDALESFRAELIQYITKARAALDGAGSEVRRTILIDRKVCSKEGSAFSHCIAVMGAMYEVSPLPSLATDKARTEEDCP